MSRLAVALFAVALATSVLARPSTLSMTVETGTGSGPVVLDLHERNVLAPDYAELVVDASGALVPADASMAVHHGCLYAGHVRGEEGASFAMVSTCDASGNERVSGSFVSDAHGRISLHPTEAGHSMVRHTTNAEDLTIDTEEVAVDAAVTLSRGSGSAAGRSLTQTGAPTKVIEVLLVSDQGRVEFFGDDTFRTAYDGLALTAAKYAVDVFAYDIEIVVVAQVAWSGGDQITPNLNGNGEADRLNLLSQFNGWVANTAGVPSADVGILLTSYNLDFAGLNYAFFRQMCQISGGNALVQSLDFFTGAAGALRLSTLTTGAIATLIGIRPDSVADSHVGTTACAQTFYMANTLYVAETATAFSACSITYLNFYFDGNANQPTPPYEDSSFKTMCLEAAAATTWADTPLCGDGLRQGDEQCDCGPGGQASDPCCHCPTCNLKDGAECSALDPCCDASAAPACAVSAAATVCRGPESACNPAETCDGVSAFCPADVISDAGVTCDNGLGGTGYCFQGACMDHATACEPLKAFNPDIVGACDTFGDDKGDDSCNSLFCLDDTLCVNIQILGTQDYYMTPMGTECDVGMQCDGAGTCVASSALTQTTTDYYWQRGAWGACSSPCGPTPGTQSRTVTCLEAATGNPAPGMCGTAPATTHACNDFECNLWVTGDWGACSANCAPGGTRTRTVHCETAAGVTVPDGDCQTTKPDTSEPCNTMVTCPTWVSGDWGDCLDGMSDPAYCTPGGTQTRDVDCILNAAVVADAECLAYAAKPPTSQACAQNACPTWQSGDWGDCSLACRDMAGNPGTQDRVVTCVDFEGFTVDDSQCVSTGAGPKPPTTQDCNDVPCASLTFSWQATAWSFCSASCGGGVSTRLVFCVSDTGSTVDDTYCTTLKPPTFEDCNTDPCSTACDPACGANEACEGTTCECVEGYARDQGGVCASVCSSAGCDGCTGPEACQACESGFEDPAGGCRTCAPGRGDYASNPSCQASCASGCPLANSVCVAPPDTCGCAPGYVGEPLLGCKATSTEVILIVVFDPTAFDEDEFRSNLGAALGVNGGLAVIAGVDQVGSDKVRIRFSITNDAETGDDVAATLISMVEAYDQELVDNDLRVVSVEKDGIQTAGQFALGALTGSESAAAALRPCLAAGAAVLAFLCALWA